MTSTRSSKWVLFSALQREGRRMSVWLALFPFLGFLYALCHGLLQALMNQDTDTVAAQDQTVRIFGSIALFLSAATIMAGAFFAISAFRFLYSRRQSDFYLSLPVTRRTFYFVKWGNGGDGVLAPDHKDHQPGEDQHHAGAKGSGKVRGHGFDPRLGQYRGSAGKKGAAYGK